MNATVAIVIKDVAKAKSKDTVRTLYFRITITGKQLYIDSGHRCAIKNFYNKNNQFVRPGTAYADHINGELRSKLADLEGILARTRDLHSSVNLELIKNLLLGKLEQGIQGTLYAVLEEWKHVRKLSSNSYVLYKISIDSFVKFCNDANYQKISAQSLNEYTKSKYYNKQYFQILRFLLVQLEKKGLISKVVLEQIYDIKPDTSKIKKEPISLNEDEITRFFELWKEDRADEMVKKVLGSFVLLCETGMRSSDMLSLNDDDIRSLNGVDFIEKHAKKGNKKFAVPLSSRAKEIIAYYKQTGSYFQFFPHLQLHTSKVTEYHKILNEFASNLGINKRLTSHVGRHSFITIMSQKGVHLAHIQSMVGHSDYKMTERYKSLDKSAAFRDFFAATTTSADNTHHIYQKLLKRLSNKIRISTVSSEELNKVLSSNGIHDDVNDYLSAKKTIGTVAYYVINKHLSMKQ